jgi:hypothetical protein
MNGDEHPIMTKRAPRCAARGALTGLFSILALLSSACSIFGSTKAAAPSSATTETPAATPRAWIVPAEILTVDEQLFYTAWLKDVPKSSRVELRLSGPGAPTEPVYEGPGGTRKIGALRLEGGDRPQVKITSRKDGPPIPLAGLAAGSYTLALTVDGKETARESFSLIEVPTCAGGKQLQVAPTARAFKPYLQPTGLALWLPWTAADEATSIRVFWLSHEGEPMSPQPASSFQHVFPRPLGLGSGNRDLDRCELASTELALFRTGHFKGFEAVFVFDDRVILGAASSTANPGELGTSAEPLAWRAPSPGARAAVEKQLEKLASNPAREDRPFWSEEAYCAIAQLPEAAKVARELIRAGGAGRSIAGVQVSAEEKLASPDAATRERARETLKRTEVTSRNAAGAFLEKRKQLDELASRFKPGCLAAMLPADFASALERRSAGAQ